MNSTHWTTLTGFAKYLGKEGKAVVDETEKGWFVAYIDRDPATIARQAARDQRNAAEVDEEVRESRKIEQQIAAINAAKGEEDGGEEDMTEEELTLAHSLIRSGEEPLKLNMSLSMRPSSKGNIGVSRTNGPAFGNGNDATQGNENNGSGGSQSSNRMKYSAGLSASLMNANGDKSGNKRQAEDLEEVSFLSEPLEQGVEDEQPSKKRSIFGDLEDDSMEVKPVVKMISNSFLSGLKSAGGGSLKLSSNKLNPNIIPVTNIAAESKPTSAIDAFMREEEEKKKLLAEKESRKDYWLHENIVVKILDKKLGEGRFYKQKAVVTKVIDNYVGELTLIDKESGGLSKTRLKMDQDDLETTIPKVNHALLIVNGKNRGQMGRLLCINTADYNVDLSVTTGGGEIEMKGVPYEDICKVFQN